MIHPRCIFITFYNISVGQFSRKLSHILYKTVTLVTGDREYVIRAQGGRLSARQIGHMFQVALCVYYDVQ